MKLPQQPPWLSSRSMILSIALLGFSASSPDAAERDGNLVAEIREAIEFTEQPMGILTVISGKVTVTNSQGQTGRTILSNSTISTDSDGDAVVDLGLLGRVELYEKTTILLTFTDAHVYVKSQCSKTSIRVIQGQVDVKSPKTETLLRGDEESYGGSVECVSNGGTDFIVDCSGKRRVIVPARRLLALLGGGAGILEFVGAEPTPVSPVLP